MEYNLFEILNEIHNPFESNILDHLVDKLVNEAYNEDNLNPEYERLMENSIYKNEKDYFKELFMKILIKYIIYKNQFKLTIEQSEEAVIRIKEESSYLKDENEQLHELGSSLSEQVSKLKSYLNEADSISKSIDDELNALKAENKRLIGVLNHFKEFENANQEKIEFLVKQNNEFKSAFETMDHQYLDSQDQIKVLRSLLNYQSNPEKVEIKSNLRLIKNTNRTQSVDIKKYRSLDRISLRKKLRRAIKSKSMQFNRKEIRVKGIESICSNVLYLRFDSMEDDEYTIPTMKSVESPKSIFLCERVPNDHIELTNAIESTIDTGILINSPGFLGSHQQSINHSCTFPEFESPAFSFTPRINIYKTDSSGEKIEYIITDKDYQKNVNGPNIFKDFDNLFPDLELNKQIQKEKIKIDSFIENKLNKAKKPIYYRDIVLLPIFSLIGLAFKIVKKANDFKRRI